MALRLACVALLALGPLCLAKTHTDLERSQFWDYSSPGADTKVFMEAAERDDLAAVMRMVRAGIDHRGLVGDPAFLAAAANGSISVVRYFVEDLHYDVDLEDDDGATAFLLAAWHGHKDVVKFLYESGADIHRRCVNGWSAVLGAARYSELDMVKYLHELGVAVHHTEQKGEWTPMMMAAAHGHHDVVQALLERAARHDHRDSQGRDVYDISRQAGHHHIADLIQRHRDRKEL